MSLYLKIGSYSSGTCTVRVSTRSVKPIEINSYIVAHEIELTVEGYLYASGPVSLSTAMDSLQAYMQVPNQIIGIVHVDAFAVETNTAHYLTTTGAIGRVRVKDFKFVDTPLSMATEVKYSLTAAALYANAYETRTLVSLDETLSITGEGGPDTVLATQAGAPSIYQDITDFTDVQVVQSGRVTGRTLPAMPSPLITLAGARVQKATQDKQSYVMRGTQIFLYVREYQYTFNLPTPPGTIAPTVLT